MSGRTTPCHDLVSNEDRNKRRSVLPIAIVRFMDKESGKPREEIAAEPDVEDTDRQATEHTKLTTAPEPYTAESDSAELVSSSRLRRRRKCSC